jgi:beta-N-acetylhexosaminidase
MSQLMPLGPVMLDVESVSLNSMDKKRLLNPLVGAVILFSRNYENPEQVKDLISEIKALRLPELLIAVDQEGGRVQRFKKGFTILPPTASFGQLWDEDKQTAPMSAFESAFTMASELVAVGVDFSFAPVFDVATVESDVIGDRSFHSIPKTATELLGAYIDGMHAGGMVAIAKHFPGHGGVSGDSHLCLPVDERAHSDIDACDLFPYRELKNEIQGVMTAHVIYSQCDKDIAGHSQYWLQNILKDDIGFDGVIFSDDLSMEGAIEVSEGIVDSAEKALAAGCDMVIVCNSPEKSDELLAGLKYTTNQQTSYKLNNLRAGSE